MELLYVASQPDKAIKKDRKESPLTITHQNDTDTDTDTHTHRVQLATMRYIRTHAHTLTLTLTLTHTRTRTHAHTPDINSEYGSAAPSASPCPPSRLGGSAGFARGTLPPAEPFGWVGCKALKTRLHG